MPVSVPAATQDPQTRANRTVVEQIACWSVRHRKVAVAGWLLFVAAAFCVGQLLSGTSAQQYDAGQAGRGEQMLDQLKVVSASAESVLIEARGRAYAPRASAAAEVRQVTREVTGALASLPRDARNIQAPFSGGGARGAASGGGARGAASGNGALLSANHLAALVTFDVAGPHAQADSTVVADLAAVARIQARHPAMIIREAGDASTDRVANAMLGHDFRKAEDTSIPLTLVLLLGVFGALVAAGIPVLLAGTAVTAAISLLAIPAQWFPVSSGTSEVVLVIGMAVGVDYSLFYLRREREERAAGHSRGAALRIAASTSGRAIVISGVTVMISLAGLFLSGLDIFTGISAGTIMVVGVTVLGSVTFLPALLSWLGPWADRGHLPWLGRRRTSARSSRLWAGLAQRVVRRPVAWGGIGVIALLALGAPALGMRLGSPAIDLPSNLPVVRTLNEIQQQFPGRPAPAEVVLTGSRLQSPAVRQDIAALAARATPGGAIRGPITSTVVAGGKGIVIQVPLPGNGSNGASYAALATLRDRVLPATVGRASGVSYAVTGNTASHRDMAAALHSRTPLVFIVVAGLALIVLMCAFRSLAIPLVSIGLNLLSVGAAYGLVTLIFQDGHLQGPLGFTAYGAIIPWVPLFSFVLLFGLSMDYHVFILSRIRELWSGGMSSTDAVVSGIGRSAGVVTSAAVIMVAVFSIFATLSGIDVKMLGVGLAAAVLIDATVVRGMILPAALAVLGERAWYLPSWLAWLPGERAADRTGERAAGGSAGERGSDHRGLGLPGRPQPGLAGSVLASRAAPAADTVGS
ncbi:MAG TPA: MMPL family transporter [Streptosporangiaceae bacterium]|nr:MMPL family transporter [Streptosporangiaceae bacterium]